MNRIFFLNAVINLVLSTMLIPVVGIAGAVVGTTAAEMAGLMIEIFLVRKFVSVKWLVMECLPYAIVGAVMCLAVKAVGTITGSGWISLGIQVAAGAAIYVAGVVGYMYIFKRKLLRFGLDEIRKKIGKIDKRSQKSNKGGQA